MSEVLGKIVDAITGLPRDEAGVVHQATKDLVDVKRAGQGYRIQGNRIIVGDADAITDRRPKAIEALGKPYETTILRPTHIYPRSKNKYNHRDLERQRVLRSLAKEKSK